MTNCVKKKNTEPDFQMSLHGALVPLKRHGPTRGNPEGLHAVKVKLPRGQPFEQCTWLIPFVVRDDYTDRFTVMH